MAAAGIVGGALSWVEGIGSAAGAAPPAVAAAEVHVASKDQSRLSLQRQHQPLACCRSHAAVGAWIDGGG
jgi:hypothetical protein